MLLEWGKEGTAAILLLLVVAMVEDELESIQTEKSSWTLESGPEREWEWSEAL